MSYLEVFGVQTGVGVDVLKFFGVGAGVGVLKRGTEVESESEKCDSAHLWCLRKIHGWVTMQFENSGIHAVMMRMLV